MAKDSQFVGAVNDSSFKNGGTDATQSALKNGVTLGGRLPLRTKSSRAQDEVIKYTPSRLEKPTKR